MISNEIPNEIPNEPQINKNANNLIISKNYIKLEGKIKKFDMRLYEKYDLPARELLKQKLGNNVQDNPDIYAQDLLLIIDKCKYKYIELQVCTTWVNDKYPYQCPFVYERKASFSNDTLFIVLNKNMSKGLLFDRESLNKKPRRLKKFSRTFVYETPWHRIIEFYFDYFDADTILSY